MSLQHTVVHTVLPNGISLIQIPLANTAAITTLVFMGVGSRYESDKQRGLAHFTEHMVFKGGKRYPTAQAIAQALDAVGGEFNAYTSQEYTGFYTKTAAEHLELGLDVLSDMLLNATFPQEELQKEKGVILEEINMYEDMPMRKVDHVLSHLLFGDTPLGRPILGSKESVQSFTPQDFLAYRSQFYMGQQCTIVLAGSLEGKDGEALVNRYFATLPTGTPYQALPAQFVETEERVALETKKSEQTHLMLAAQAMSLSDPRRFAMRVLTTVLGGNMSSRLFTSVREQQGLCYYVRATPDVYLDAGFIVASAGVDNNRLAQAVEAIVREFSLVRKNGITEEELTRAKRFLVGKTLLAMEDSESVAEYYASQDRLEGTQRTVAQAVEELERVTLKDVQEVAEFIFQDERLRLAVIGPHKDAAALNVLLAL